MKSRRRGQKSIKGRHEGMMKRRQVETQRWNIKRNKKQDVEK